MNELPNSTNADRCQYCGALVIGGYAGCQSLMQDLTVQASDGLANYTAYRAAVDCYMLQHPEIGCVSAKSYAAHLAGLCCKIEHKGQQEIHAAVQKWLNGAVDIQKPKILTFRGNLTATHLQAAADAEEYMKRVDEWSSSVWEAYSELQDTARFFIKSALAAKQR